MKHKLLKTKKEFNKWIENKESFLRDAGSILDIDSIDFTPQVKQPKAYPVFVYWSASLSPPYSNNGKTKHRMILICGFIDRKEFVF